MPEPIRRHPALQPLSREHHEALLLYFKIRQGLKKGVDCTRIAAYARWFFEQYLQPHFQIEEEQLFPLLGKEHHLIVRACEEHAKLRRQFSDSLSHEEDLLAAGKALEDHVRFEERVLFNLIQDSIEENRLLIALKVPADAPSCSLWQDEFWR